MILNSQLPEMHYILQSTLSLYSLQSVWWIHLDPASDISVILATSLGMLQLTTRTQSQCQANIWHVYPSTNVCHINQLWKQYDNYSCSFWYNAPVVAHKSNTPVTEMWLYHLFKNIPNMKQKKWTLLHKMLKQMFTNENKYDKLIVHIIVLLEPCGVQHTLFGVNGILQYKWKCQYTKHLTSWQVNQELTQQMLFLKRLTEIPFIMKQATMCHMKSWDC